MMGAPQRRPVDPVGAAQCLFAPGALYRPLPTVGGWLCGPWPRRTGPWDEGHPLLDTIAALYCAGGAFCGDDEALHRPRLLFCLRLGQWFAETDDEGRLRSWGAWLRTSDEGLRLIEQERELMVNGRAILPVERGPHAYIADLTVAPVADANAYRRMIAHIERWNRTAETLSGHFCKRDGRIVWRQRRIRA